MFAMTLRKGGDGMNHDMVPLVMRGDPNFNVKFSLGEDLGNAMVHHCVGMALGIIPYPRVVLTHWVQCKRLPSCNLGRNETGVRGMGYGVTA
jgi:hypothetical protein